MNDDAVARATSMASTSNETTRGDAARARGNDEDAIFKLMNDFSPTDAREPLVFMSWNANGLLNRVRDKVQGRGGVPREAMALREAVMKRKPDVIALQEVWLKCAGGPSKGRGDAPWCVFSFLVFVFERVVATAFECDGLTLASRASRRRHAEPSADGKYGDDKTFIEDMMRRAPFKNYDVHWCLATAKRHGVGVLVKKGLKTPIRVSRTLDIDDAVDETPDDIDTNEGRVLVLEYENMVVVNTYVPHNGGTLERHEKRALWDHRVRRFLSHHVKRKDVVWTGDLNVAHRDLDVGPHPAMFEGVGGFTLPERRRFTDALAATSMVDAYRAFHGDKSTFTWRGGNGSGWRGMRLDYFIISASLASRIENVFTSTDKYSDEIAQTMPVSCFFGSDHCALFLELRRRAEHPSRDDDEDDDGAKKKRKTDTEDAIVIE